MGPGIDDPVVVTMVDVVDAVDVLVVVGVTAALWALEQPATTINAADHRRSRLRRIIGSSTALKATRGRELGGGEGGDCHH